MKSEWTCPVCHGDNLFSTILQAMPGYNNQAIYICLDCGVLSFDTGKSQVVDMEVEK